jgi:DNA-binding GntR family transcriptional regulator
MTAVLRTLPPAVTELDNEKLIEVDQACHEIIYEAADNKFLANLCVTHYALSLRLWYFFLNKIGDMRGAIEEHARIRDALQAGELETAVTLMTHHIHAFQDEIQAVMLGGIATSTGTPRRGETDEQTAA